MLGILLDAARIVVGLAVLALLLYVPGSITLNSFATRRPAPHIFTGTPEWLFAAIILSVLVTGLFGFVLAQVGFFSAWTVLLLVIAYSLVAARLGGVKLRSGALLRLLRLPSPYPQRAADHRLVRLERLALLLLVLLAAGLFSRPGEMLRGALDSGVYVNDGVALGRTGAIFQRDPIMRRLDDDKGEGRELLQGLNPDRYILARNRMPGFYVYDKQEGLVVPQHYFLYPVWIGLLYTLFGIWGALYATPLLALLFVMSVYFFARRALTPSAALLGLALLIICPVIIWFARYPVSEVIMGLLAFIAFYAFMRMLQLSGAREQPGGTSLVGAESPNSQWARLWGVICALALGQMALARPDFIFYVAPVPLYLLYWRLSRNWRAAYTWFAVTLGAMLLLFLVHYAVYSYPYTLDLYHNTIINLRRAWRPLLIAAYVGTLLLLGIDRMYSRVRPFWARLEGIVARYRWAWAGGFVLLVFAYGAFHYLVGPWLPNDRHDRAGRLLPQLYQTTFSSYIGAPTDQGSRYNLVRVGWYLSPFGMGAGLAGLLRWIWSRLDAATGLFFGSLLITGFIFIQETYTEAHYIYTMRRYVPVILPALILGFAWLCHWLWSRFRPRIIGMGTASIAAFLLALFFIYTGRTIIGHVEEAGAIGQFSQLAAKFGGKSIVLFSNERDEPYVVATPLQYIYGVESFVLTHSYPEVNNTALAGLVSKWRQQGYKVWAVLGANGGKLDLPGFMLKEEGSWTYDVPEFQQLYYQKPLNVSRATLPWGIYSIEANQGVVTTSWPYKFDIGGMDYSALVSGFYIQERAPVDRSHWRWTGDHAILQVPWPQDAGGAKGGATVTLRLRPESPVPGKRARRTGAVHVKVMLESSPIGEVLVPAGSDFADYTFQVPPGTKTEGGRISTAYLHIVSDTWSAQEAGVSDDTRALGIQIDSVEVKP